MDVPSATRKPLLPHVILNEVKGLVGSGSEGLKTGCKSSVEYGGTGAVGLIWYDVTNAVARRVIAEDWVRRARDATGPPGVPLLDEHLSASTD